MVDEEEDKEEEGSRVNGVKKRGAGRSSVMERTFQRMSQIATHWSYKTP